MSGLKAMGDREAGLLIALAGFAALSVGDGVIKSIAGQWPGTAVAALRYTLGTLGLGAVLWFQGGRAAFALPMPGMQMLRGGAVALATLCFFLSIFIMPLAEATAIQFTNPMLTAILSALVLRERIRWPMIIATIIAFIGVLIVLRPNFAALGWAAVLPIIAALGMAALMMGNRAVANAGSVLLMQFLVALFAAPVLIAATLIGHVSGVEGFVVTVPSWSVIARCVLVAVTASISHLLVYLATTRASAATIAPMVYVQLLVAMAIGAAFYGDWPDGVSLIGSAIIIASGLWLWWRERKRV